MSFFITNLFGEPYEQGSDSNHDYDDDRAGVINLSQEPHEQGISCDSDHDDDDRAGDKPRVLHSDKLRSRSAHNFMRRAEKVWAFPSTTEEEKVESLKRVRESKPEPEEEKVGDVVLFGKNSYFVVDIFEKEIMELGDKVDLNFKRFRKLEAVDGDAPRDHHFYKYRCCYNSCCCVCSTGAVERELVILERGLALKEKKGVSFFVRTYQERKELMRVAVTVTDSHHYHSLYFFDLLFPTEYPYGAPSFYYHPYGLPLTTLDSQRSLRVKLRYNILDVFLHIQDIVLMNTNKSCHQMLDMMERPLAGFQDFVKGFFRKKGPLILRNLMEEFDMEKERDKKMFWKVYTAFVDNKAYCEHLLNSELKAELEKMKEKEYTLSDYYYGSTSPYYPTYTKKSDGIKKTSKNLSFLSKYLPFDY
ncbi:PREDICTED: probable ubiquitin-conjugating enzyme E2 23 [Camelina sativa]|uniref:Probable ubiquitin-conjugating enzyme E2 23 n=1 Tax=Camelina sativa TaxID=90675 RepID=A0ABM0W383_CAMSA|nr:PREDICTED: probable ubiquitin-conjugating enzyme E2 23 [Camelina sativa]